jgi:3-dehydroquinate dehydratase
MTKCYAYDMHEKDRDHIFTYDAPQNKNIINPAALSIVSVCAHHALQDISVCTTTLVAPVRLIIIF